MKQARKALFSLLKKARSLQLPIRMQLHLYNTMVVPIVLYGSEVWGMENVNVIEQFQLKFGKLIMK